MASRRLTSRRMLAAAAVLGSALLGGCSGFGDAVHRQFDDRAPLPSCGRVDLGISEELEGPRRTEVDCLTAALASGAGGELVVTVLTTEGDPVTEYLRVTPAGTTEVYTDASKDRFGDRKWTFASCPTPTSALDTSC